MPYLVKDREHMKRIEKEVVWPTLAPLAEKMTFVKEGSEVAPGIVAHEAFGHSPGHLIFRVESEGKGLVITGDTANHFVLSLQKPRT